MATELDYMEYANDGAAQAAYVSSDSGTEPGSWDLLDEDCSDISDWVDGDTNTAVSEVSPAGQFRFDTNAGAAGNAVARRYRDIGDTPNTFTFEIKFYHDDIGSALTDGFYFDVRQADEILRVQFNANKITILDTDSGTTEVGTDLVLEGGSAEWQTWRFVVTYGTVGDGVCDVYLNDTTHTSGAWSKVGAAIPCSLVATVTDGFIYLLQQGYITDNMLTHIDYIKMATGLYAPIPALQSYSESIIKTQGSYSLKGVAAITDSLNDTLTRTIV